jgi:UDP-N-acetylglucosamine 4-epimerase
MTEYPRLRTNLVQQPKRWLVTGVAGFIGSNLLETLLSLDQEVVGLDDFATGHQRNLDQVRSRVSLDQWGRFTMHCGSIQDMPLCRSVCRGADYVLHQAALGSVPLSIEDPIRANESNVNGFLNMLVAARDAQCRGFVYASSSAVYGDCTALPAVEHRIGKCLSPYGATKYIDEVYAGVFGVSYGFQGVGLRYFNVFGPRQDPHGPYAAVIPCWIAAMIRNQPIFINGDGETTRDFCYVDNVVQANLLAATASTPEAKGQVYNIALNSRISLNQLFSLLRERLAPHYAHVASLKPVYREFRSGDVRHSEADISRARQLLGYEPSHVVAAGLDAALDWYRSNLA